MLRHVRSVLDRDRKDSVKYWNLLGYFLSRSPKCLFFYEVAKQTEAKPNAGSSYVRCVVTA